METYMTYIYKGQKEEHGLHPCTHASADICTCKGARHKNSVKASIMEACASTAHRNRAMS
eukprot:1155836-Pelagomonas_calceolata.AAC.3